MEFFFQHPVDNYFSDYGCRFFHFLCVFLPPETTAMKRIFLFIFLTAVMASYAAGRERRSVVKLETTMGVIRIALSDDTPGHRDNFLKLTKAGFYDRTLFHRVIKDFMIQGGDPLSKPGTADSISASGNGSAVQKKPELGEGGPGYCLAPEFDLPYLYHKRGAVAMAREGDDVNPDRLSNGSQFYIVYGKTYTLDELNRLPVDFTLDMSLDYRTVGGAPHLDGAYTVFGEVIEGMEIVEKIQQQPTDAQDRPLSDVRIIKATVEQMSTAYIKSQKKKYNRRYYHSIY